METWSFSPVGKKKNKTKREIVSTQARFERAPPKRIDFESIGRSVQDARQCVKREKKNKKERRGPDLN